MCYCQQIAWAHSEHGGVIACATADGLINIWQQAQASADQPGQWQLASTLKESLKPITSLQFAPRQLGPMLAAASQDTTIRFYRASAPLNADTWQLCNDLKVQCVNLMSSTSHAQHVSQDMSQIQPTSLSILHVLYQSLGFSTRVQGG